MGKITTLNTNNAFRYAYTRGKYFTSPVLVTYVVKSKHKNNKIGITTSKKVGKAVQRNRARRVIKEAYRLVFDNVRSGFNIVFVARSKTPHVKMNIVQKDMIVHLKKAGLWK